MRAGSCGRTGEKRGRPALAAHRPGLKKLVHARSRDYVAPHQPCKQQTCRGNTPSDVACPREGKNVPVRNTLCIRFRASGGETLDGWAHLTLPGHSTGAHSVVEAHHVRARPLPLEGRPRHAVDAGYRGLPVSRSCRRSESRAVAVRCQSSTFRLARVSSTRKRDGQPRAGVCPCHLTMCVDGLAAAAATAAASAVADAN